MKEYLISMKINQIQNTFLVLMLNSNKDW